MSFRAFLRIGALVALSAGFTFADSISSVIVYGDSLSDNGNLFKLTGQPGPPYYMGRVSNGPVAVEQLASSLNVPLIDFAFAGATTGLGNILDGGSPTKVGSFNLPGMLPEYDSAASMGAIAQNPNGLYIVWGGPNDFASLPPNATPGQVQAAVNLAVGDLLTIVDGLRSQGIKNILVPGMPDLGLTPEYEAQGKVIAGEATALTNLFNATLVSELPTGTHYFDTADLLRTIVKDPSYFGFTDVTDACYNGKTVCADPNSYLFFDSAHPTTYADSILAQDFLSSLAPEPSSYLLMGASLLGFAFFRRRAIAK